MEKLTDAAEALLEEMDSNNYHWSGERVTPKSCGEKYEINVMTLLASSANALIKRLDKVGASYVLVGSSISSIGVYVMCEACGMQGHASIECDNGLSIIEHANALYSFDPPPQNNLYSDTYNPGWNNHPNLSYKNSNLQSYSPQ